MRTDEARQVGRLARREKDDAYVPLPEYGVRWAEGNRKSLIVAGIALVAVLLVVGIAAAIYNARSEKASVAFGAAMQTYQTPLATSGQQVPPGLKTYPSAADRARVAAAEFAGVAQQYGFTPDGKNAKYFAGLSYMEAGQNGTAESVLRDVSTSWNSNLASLGKLALSQLYRGTARNADAVQLLDQLSKKPTAAVPAGVAQLQLAELYESEGKADQARKIYAELKDKDAKSAAGVIAAQKLNPTAAPAGGPGGV